MPRHLHKWNVLGFLLASGLLTLLVAGCSGSKEGPPPGNADNKQQEGQPAGSDAKDKPPEAPREADKKGPEGKPAGADARDNPPKAADGKEPAGTVPTRAEEVRKSQENLARIGKGLVGNGYPAGFCDLEGKPILSWRVALLPLLGYPELFAKFKLDEPWDGPTNKKLIAEIPDVYQPVRGTAPAGHTFYQGLVGDEAIFPAQGPDNSKNPGSDPSRYVLITARPTSDIHDGTAHTFLVVEAATAIPWTKPGDLPYDPKKPVPTLGGLFEGDFNACFCDGSVRLVPKGLPEKTLRALITPASGEKVDLSGAGLSEPFQGGTAP